MNDLVHDTALAIVPLLSAGAGAAAHDLAEQAGSGVSAALARVLDKIRHRLTSERPDVHEVGGALQDALAAGDLTEADLRLVVNQAGRDNTSMQAGRNIYNGDITVRGVFNG